MEQEIQFLALSPRKIRRQLTFATPTKQPSSHNNRTEEIQMTPKGKLSKSKVIGKVSKNKLVIDFDLEKNYLLDDIDTTEYFRLEEKSHLKVPQSSSDTFLCSTAAKSWQCDSPFKTARKPRITSANISDFTSIIKEPRNRRCVEESPFCRLLNESDLLSAESYQTFTQDYPELEEPATPTESQYCNQVETVEKFFSSFQERSSSIMDLFTQASVFEIVNEPKVHSLNITLNALAKVFLKFEQEPGFVEFDYKFAKSEDEEEIIITTTGKMVSQGFQPDFILSCKVGISDCLIRHAKLKIC